MDVGGETKQSKHATGREATIIGLHVFPIIGCLGAPVTAAELLPDAGFAMDSTWAIVSRASPDEIFTNEATESIRIALQDDGANLVLTAPGMAALCLEHDFAEGLLEPVLLKERAQHGIGDVCRRHPQGSLWVSEYLLKVKGEAALSEQAYPVSQRSWRSIGEAPFGLLRLQRVASLLGHQKPVMCSSLARESTSESSSGDDSSGSGDEGSLGSPRRAARSLPKFQHSRPHLSWVNANSVRRRLDTNASWLQIVTELARRVSSRLLWPERMPECLAHANVVIAAPRDLEATWRQVMVRKRDGGIIAVDWYLSRTTSDWHAYTVMPRQGGELHVGDRVDVVRWRGRTQASLASRTKPLAPGPMGISGEAFKVVKEIAAVVACTACMLGAVSWMVGMKAGSESHIPGLSGTLTPPSRSCSTDPTGGPDDHALGIETAGLL